MDEYIYSVKNPCGAGAPNPGGMAAGEPPAPYGSAPDPGMACFGKRQGEYTLQDREAFPEDLRTELIDGVIYLMASPSRPHQIIAGQIYHQLCSFIYSRDGSCTPFIAPSDVRLDRDDFTVVQPDVYVVCGRNEEEREEKNGEEDRKGDYSEGAPDFVAEVLSPSTRFRDMTIKAEKYRKAGVREYWIVDPNKEIVITYVFSGDPDIAIRTFDDAVPVAIYGGECQIDFAQIRERVNRYLR